jgi:hypothetical protein
LKVASWLGVSIGLALLGAAPRASAQGYNVFTPEEQEDRVGAEFDWLNAAQPNGISRNIFTWDITAQVLINPTIYILVDVPFSYASVPPSESKFLFGNPLIGAHWADSIAGHVSLFAGAMVGIPLTAGADLASIVAAERIGSIRGYAGLARFAPRTLPIVVRAGFELIFAPFYMKVDFLPTVLAPLGSEPSAATLPNKDNEFGLRPDLGIATGQTVVLMDQGNEFGLRADFGLLGGLRLQESFVLSNAEDRVQFALEPFIGYEGEIEKGFFGRLGFLVALDNKAGFGFGAGKDKLARLTLGYKFF